MTDRRPDFQLSIETAKKMIEILGPSWDNEAERATPKEICQELGIDRRAFNSAISKAIFAKRPTEAQVLLRTHIMEIIYTEIYVD